MSDTEFDTVDHHCVYGVGQMHSRESLTGCTLDEYSASQQNVIILTI